MSTDIKSVVISADKHGQYTRCIHCMRKIDYIPEIDIEPPTVCVYCQEEIECS